MERKTFGLGRFVGSTLVFASLVGISGCSLGGLGKLDGLGALEFCDGATIEEVINAKNVSDECKASLEAYLPKPVTNFDGKLSVLGSVEQDDGSLDIYVHGATTGDKALAVSDFESAKVSVVVEGESTLLGKGDFTVSAVDEAPNDLLSISVVTDYSGSMSDADLEAVAEIESDIFSVLPPIYEGSVTYFSTKVLLKEDYTESKADLLSAVTYDPEFERDLTALYDGIAAGVEGLEARTRPLKLLVVATDGIENASERATRADVETMIDESGAAVLMLGALFSEPEELSDLAGDRGIYFYTPYYADAKKAVASYLESLKNIAKITIPPAKRGDGPVSIESGGSRGEL